MGCEADEPVVSSSVIRLTRPAMACEFEIVLCGENRDYLEDAATLALDEVERLDSQLSCFNPISEVSFLNAEAANRPVVVEPGFFHLLELAKQVWSDTDGAFDITAGPVIDLWRVAEREGREPDRQAVGEALTRVGMSHILLNERDNSVSYDTEGIRVNFGAIGKGFAAGRAADVLRECGISSALVSAGRSSICAVGSGPDGEGWKVGIRHPSNFDERVHKVTLCNSSMSTSGGTAQRDEKVEEKFEHIVDPITGLAARPTAVSVSVITHDPALSDALSTAFYLRGKSMAENYCRAHEGVGVVFVEPAGSGFSAYQVGDLPDIKNRGEER